MNSPSATMNNMCAGHYCDCGRVSGRRTENDGFMPATPPTIPRLSPPPLLRRRQQQDDTMPSLIPPPSPRKYLARTHAIFEEDVVYERPRARTLSAESDVTYSTMPPLIDTRINRHIYFDDDGNEMTKDEHTAEKWAIKIPPIKKSLVARHPRVLLAYFDFLEVYNEMARGDESFMIPAIPESVLYRIYEHPSFVAPRIFPDEITRLEEYLSKNANLSE